MTQHLLHDRLASAGKDAPGSSRWTTTMTTNNLQRTTVAAATVLSMALALAVSRSSAHAGTQATAAGPAGAPGQAGPAPGAGRGGVNPATASYAEHCASCHGNDLAGGRAPSLFNRSEERRVGKECRCRWSPYQ